MDNKANSESTITSNTDSIHNKNSRKRLFGKVCLITGAARGIGLATAKAFINEGATVVLSDLDDACGQNEAKTLGEKASYFHLDVSKPDQWQYVMEQIQLEHSKIDVLVNNAGITGQQPGFGPQDPENMTLESWDRVHHINSDGVFLGCKYAIKYMKKNSHSSIINVSSRSGIVGIPGSAAYASSKASVRNHTKSVALYCAEKGYDIRCNSVHPAAIMTPLWEPFLGSGENRVQNLKTMVAGIPLKRMGRPEEVAATILFLATDECLFMTGSELIIDGGILAGSASAPQNNIEKEETSDDSK